jgi:hypothetical protein
VKRVIRESKKMRQSSEKVAPSTVPRTALDQLEQMDFVRDCPLRMAERCVILRV